MSGLRQKIAAVATKEVQANNGQRRFVATKHIFNYINFKIYHLVSF